MQSNASDARQVALALLCDVTIHGKLLPEVLARRLSPLVAGDRARAQRLALTTLRVMDRADRMLGPYLQRRPSDRIMNILRLGVAEICQDKSAPHGVVNAMVDLVRLDKRETRLSGLVNAVLRKVAGDVEKWEKLPVPRLPKWLRKPLLADYGKDIVLATEAAHYAGAPLDLTAKGDPERLAMAVGGEVLLMGSVRLQNWGQVSALPGFEAGDWWVQDAAAAMPARVLDTKPGESVLDLCAAPGGKTMQLAATGATVTAVDVSETRMKRVIENLSRCNLKAKTVVADAVEFDEAGFDAVLLDAPCSATGTIRRHPDLPYAKDGSEFPALFELQAKLIDKALALLKPGGRLVYCTCSLLIDEGEEQIRDALTRHKGLKVDRDALLIPGIKPDWADDLGGLRLRSDFLASKGGMDGFYIAALTKG
ncbi:MAG: methyltransferase domain-containing protein [Rhodobacteraceae bacterium]|nr:methyltransferase domain-containing protein [Paracoccaceae bacterium]